MHVRTALTRRGAGNRPCIMESRVIKDEKKIEEPNEGGAERDSKKNLTRRNRVTGQKDGVNGRNRFSEEENGPNGKSSTGRIKYQNDRRAQARARLRHLAESSRPPARSAFPALDRENVITDLINWTYGRRRTK